MDKKPTQNDNGSKPPADKTQADPYRDYIDSKMRYYRDVLRNQDQQLIRMLSKVPDDWDQYKEKEKSESLPIREDTKLRLSDIKKSKSWEIKFESLYVSYIVSIERQLTDCFHFRPIEEDGINEGIDSVNSVMLETEGNIINYKNLLLSLAKRSVSDLYYLMVAYYRFFKKKNFVIEEYFPDFCRDAVAILQNHSRLGEILDEMKIIGGIIEPFFTKTMQAPGLRLNEEKLKQSAESKEYEGILRPDRLKKIIAAASSLKNRIRKTREFMSYYYNNRDGKEYRYNYITETLTRKFEEGKLSQNALDGFKEIYRNFTSFIREFERMGLRGFGPPGFSYEGILEFIFKAGKVMEFIYLRSMMYAELNDIRGMILRPSEQELIDIRGASSK